MSYMSLKQNTSMNGVKYYTYSYADGWGPEDGGYTSDPYIQLGMAKHYLKNGWYTNDTAEGTDDTDFLVLDFDISTDTNQFDQLYFQTLFYFGKKTEQSDGSYKGVRTTAQSGHYILLGDSGEDAYFLASSDKETKIAIDLEDMSEWAHITMIVDATTDTSRKMHLYYNGRYVDSRVCMTDNAVFLESLRISVDTIGTAPDLANESLSIANATVKAFGKGYSGDLAEERENLGSVLYPLSSFADLDYCLSNLPESKVAELTHADGSVDIITKISELDANLVAGDAVKLYRDIARKIVIPGRLENEVLTSAVSFDLNGHSMVEPLVLADYDELDWIVRDAEGNLLTYTASDSVILGKGAQEYDGDAITDTLYAFISGAYPTGFYGGVKAKITFLKDTTIKYAASVKHGTSNVTYDLNGKTLTISAGSKVPFQSSASASRVVIRDGKIVNNMLQPIYLVNGAYYYIVNAEISASSSLVDQRAGTLFVIGSKLDMHNTLTSLKSYSRGSANAVIDGCTLTFADSNPISFSNLRTESARRGSMNNFVGIYDTDVSGNSSIIDVSYFANEWTGANADALANENNVRISIQDTNVDISGEVPLISASIDSLNNLSNVFAEGFTATTDIYIDNSSILADTIVSTDDDAAFEIINKRNIAVGAFSADTNVVLKRSSIKSGAYVFVNTIGTADDNGGISALIHDKVRLTSHQWAKESDSSVIVEFTDGVKLAYSYEQDYPYIATLDWSEDTLVGNRSETTTVKLSAIFADGMVLQAHKDIAIYGTCATVGADIEVALGDKAVRTTVGADGRWSVTLAPMEYQNGLTLTINELGLMYPETRFENVHIGEIWMASGQSNSVYGVYKMEDFAEYKSNADNFDNIYAFAVHMSQSLVEKEATTNSGWYKVTSSTLSKDDRYTGISAIAYVMATRLATELGPDVAIGILDINFNGSTVEAWMSAENLAKVDPVLNEKYNAYREYYEKNGAYPSASDVSAYGSYIDSGKLYSKMPTSCYNAMIAPFFEGFAIRGVIWDQGGANAGSVSAESEGDYRAHFTGVRDSFRDAFGDEELPVFIIQLPPRMSDTFYFRALQYDLALKDENTYVVASPTSGSTYSKNELKNTSPESDSMVHYERKSPVGLALADSALENVYMIDNNSAPNIVSITKQGGAIIITFDRDVTIDSGVEMLGFEIAGIDEVWVAAKATYSGNIVTLSADGISAPDRVRYGKGESILTLKDGTEIIHNKKYASFVYDEAAGTVTITTDDRVYVIDTSNPDVIGARMPGNVIAKGGAYLPVFLAVVE